jgi:DNA-binding winged helix-turn-helix (wHTH) protein
MRDASDGYRRLQLESRVCEARIQMRQTFGDCLFDRDRRELVRGGSIVHGGPKLFALLEVLIDAAPRAVTKEEIHKAIWPETFVTDATLTSLLAELRTAIGDDAKTPRLVRTIHGYGYAFIGDISEDRPPRKAAAGFTAFRLIVGERDIALATGDNIIGRASDVAVFVDDGGVSRQHARITVDDRGAVLEDLGSKNGTMLDGKRIDRRTPLADGALIVVGATALRFRVFTTSVSTETISR